MSLFLASPSSGGGACSLRLPRGHLQSGLPPCNLQIKGNRFQDSELKVWAYKKSRAYKKSPGKPNLFNKKSEGDTLIIMDLDNIHMPKELRDYSLFVQNLKLYTRKHNFYGHIEMIGFGDVTFLRRYLHKFAEAGFLVNHIPSGVPAATDMAIISYIDAWTQGRAPGHVHLIACGKGYRSVLIEARTRHHFVSLTGVAGKVARSLLGESVIDEFHERDDMARGALANH